MELVLLRKDLTQYIARHKLSKKWVKVKKLFKLDIKHPSLSVELLEPHWHGIYSFRIDKKYRAIFFIKNNEAEIIQITNHYKK